MKTVLITGAGGFLGTSLVKRFLQEKEFQIIAMTSQSEKFSAYHNEKQLQIIPPDAENVKWEQVDLLVHAAFPRGNNSLLLAQGMEYYTNILEQATQNGVGAVIHLSSQSVYHKRRRREATEQSSPQPKGDYAVAKYASELITKCLCKNIPHTSIRLASLVGAGFDVRIVNKFVKQVLEGKDLQIQGGKQCFALMDVKDAAEGIVYVAKSNPHMWKELYNLGTDTAYSLFQLAECVEDTVYAQCGIRTSIQRKETEDWQSSALDSTVFYEEFHWKPHYTLEDTIREIISGYR